MESVMLSHSGLACVVAELATVPALRSAGGWRLMAQRQLAGDSSTIKDVQCIGEELPGNSIVLQVGVACWVPRLGCASTRPRQVDASELPGCINCTLQPAKDAVS
jgi:hypothetical protein